MGSLKLVQKYTNSQIENELDKYKNRNDIQISLGFSTRENYSFLLIVLRKGIYFRTTISKVNNSGIIASDDEMISLANDMEYLKKQIPNILSNFLKEDSPKDIGDMWVSGCILNSLKQFEVFLTQVDK